jgi:PBP1b-binding outer membrane lipoprotein LpoB
MKKIILISAIFVLALLIFGCQPAPTETVTDTDLTEADIEADISEIESIEQDINLTELDEIDQMIKELE